jgi:hypothetical protein
LGHRTTDSSTLKRVESILASSPSFRANGASCPQPRAMPWKTKSEKCWQKNEISPLRPEWGGGRAYYISAPDISAILPQKNPKLFLREFSIHNSLFFILHFPPVPIRVNPRSSVVQIPVLMILPPMILPCPHDSVRSFPLLAPSRPWAFALSVPVPPPVQFHLLPPAAPCVCPSHYGAITIRKSLMMRALQKSAFFRLFSLTKPPYMLNFA